MYIEINIKIFWQCPGPRKVGTKNAERHLGVAPRCPLSVENNFIFALLSIFCSARDGGNHGVGRGDVEAKAGNQDVRAEHLDVESLAVAADNLAARIASGDGGAHKSRDRFGGALRETFGIASKSKVGGVIIDGRRGTLVTIAHALPHSVGLASDAAAAFVDGKRASEIDHVEAHGFTVQEARRRARDTESDGVGLLCLGFFQLETHGLVTVDGAAFENQEAVTRLRHGGTEVAGDGVGEGNENGADGHCFLTFC